MELPRLGRTWMPELLPVSSEMVELALREGVLSQEEVVLLATLEWHDPRTEVARQKVCLLRLQTEGAPVQ